MCLVKAHVRGLTLKKLLDMPIVAEIDLPPTPVFDAVQTGRADKKNFAQPPKPNLDGPRVCVVDSGIAAAHPLLASNVGHEEAILTAATSPADRHGHGTRVGAIAVFGSVRACYESGAFSSPVVLFSARVLNERNQFDDERLIVKQMQAAIRTFKKAPHACRVFNLSLGTFLPANSGKQSTWAEALDVLAREEQVVIVVSAGNNRSRKRSRALDFGSGRILLARSRRHRHTTSCVSRSRPSSKPWRRRRPNWRQCRRRTSSFAPGSPRTRGIRPSRRRQTRRRLVQHGRSVASAAGAAGAPDTRPISPPSRTTSITCTSSARRRASTAMRAWRRES
jgi:hypothetical protein